jgi:hypothetical protein
MQFGVGLRPRVLLRDAPAELDVLAKGLPKRRVVGQTRFVGGLHVEGGEARALFVGDGEVAMDVDQVLKTNVRRESVGVSERLRGEPRRCST